jgi:hypothetical protein
VRSVRKADKLTSTCVPIAYNRNDQTGVCVPLGGRQQLIGYVKLKKKYIIS